jgi:drug/metabolite transporter (DMT)-like permease
LNLLGPGELLSLACGVLWAFAVILFKRSGEDAPPLALNLFKGIVSLVVFFPLLFLFGEPAADWPAEVWAYLAISGVLGISVADTLFFMALNRLGAGLNAVVDCLYFPFMAVASFLALGNRLTFLGYVGGGLVVAAVLLGSVTRPPPGRTRKDLVTGILLGVVGMALLPASVVLIKPILLGDSALTATTFRLSVGTGALALPVLFGPDRRAFLGMLRPAPVWRTALPASVIGGAFAMWAWIEGYRLIEDPSLAAILHQLSTIWIFLLAGLFLREPFTPRRVVAVIVAFGGVLLVALAMPGQ